MHFDFDLSTCSTGWRPASVRLELEVEAFLSWRIGVDVEETERRSGRSKEDARAQIRLADRGK